MLEIISNGKNILASLTFIIFLMKPEYDNWQVETKMLFNIIVKKSVL